MIDPARLTDLFAAHAGPLALYARQVAEPADVDECVQEAFVRLMGERVEPPNVRAWLILTLRRLVIDRRRAWFRRRSRERAMSGGEWFVPTHDDAIDGAAVARELATLDARDREIVVLRIWNGLTLDEIGRTVGLSTSRTHERLAIALKQLRERMEKSSCPSQTKSKTSAG